MTVVIPTRDRWPLLSSAALPSALGQVDVEHEVVVVDDGSADGTADRVEAWSDARLRVIRTGRLGAARARNAGLAAARGGWVAFLDDDDLWSPRALRAQLDAAAAAAADFVCAGGVIVDARGAVLQDHPAPNAAELARTLLRRNVVGGPSRVMARAELVRSLGGFDESLPALEDWDLWIRLAQAGKGAACHERLVAYREHAANASIARLDDQFSALRRLVERHGGGAGGVDAIQFTKWVAKEQRRAGRRWATARAYLSGGLACRSPALLARAVAAPVGATGLAGRVRAWRGAEQPPRPDWLQLYERAFQEARR